MSERDGELEQLRAQVAAMRELLKHAAATAQAAQEMAMALALTHPDSGRVLQVFNEFAKSSEDAMLYSSMSDDDLARIDARRSAYRRLLQAP